MPDFFVLVPDKRVSPVELNLDRSTAEAGRVVSACVLHGPEPRGLYLDVTRFLRDLTR